MPSEHERSVLNRFVRQLVDDTDAMLAAEDADQPHVAICFDLEAADCGEVSDGITCVRGPYDSAADAMLAAIQWADELGSDGSTGWQPMIARLFKQHGE